jgi:hypothetical protein
MPRRHSGRRRLSATIATAALLLPGAAIVVAGTATPAGAAPFTVSNTNPSGPGSLPQAFANASLSTDPSNTITVAPGLGTIDLTGLLTYNPANNSALSIEGNGVTIHQTAATGIIASTSAGTLTLDGATLTGGNSSVGGGAIQTDGALNLSNCTVTGNTDTGVTADILRVGATTIGTITITNCSVSGNTLTGGVAQNGIVDAGQTTATGSTFDNNVMTVTSGHGASGDVFDTLDTTITSSTVNNNTDTSQTGSAFGTLNTSNLTLTGTTIAGNVNTSVAGGEALGTVNASVFTATSSAITGNTNSTTADTADGVIDAKTADLTDSSVTGNTNAAGTGTASGGIDVGGASLTNSTVSDNTASGTGGSSGGGIDDGAPSAHAAGSSGKHQPAVGAQATAGAVVLVYATVTGNQAQTGANIDSFNPLTAFGSVVAKPVGGVDCVLNGATSSQGWNFSDDSTCGFTNTTSGDRQSAGDPHLGAPADNGGPAPTQLPQTGSPLIDAIPLGSCQAGGAAGITTDERGVTRPQGAGCDIGAVEVAVTLTAAFTG